MFKLFLLVSSLLIILTVDVSAKDCAHRNYGHGSTVCVCNATYCDSIPPIPKTDKGIVTPYVTSISGDRFAKQEELHFSKNPITHVASTITLTLNSSRKYQKIIGFGGAFTDAAGINVAKLPKDMQTRLIKDYFGSDGIEYSLGRIPIGGCDFSPRPYTYDDHPGDVNLTKFALQPEDMHFKIPFIHLAKEVSAQHIKLFASPWSPPAWMKTNNKLNNGGFLIGEPGGHYYKCWARYLIRFLDAYKKEKVDIWGITVQNEPEAGFIDGFKWNSLALNQTQERDFIKLDLGPELHKNGYTKDKLKVMMHDGQMPLAKGFVEATLSDKDAAKYVSGIAFHWYMNLFADWNDLDQINKQYPDYFLLATEACQEAPPDDSGKAVSLGNWDVFNRYADDIIKDLNHFTTGWTDWNLALDTSGGPNWAGNLVDAPIIVNASAGEFLKQPIFYAMGHFSKFLPPDSVRIYHDAVTVDKKNILATTFLRPDNGTVLTILNKNNHSIIAQVKDEKYGYFVHSVKAEALQTFIWY